MVQRAGQDLGIPLPARERGRRPQLDNTAIQVTESLVAHGVTREDACQVLGIDYSTMWRWMKRGEEAQADVDEHLVQCSDDTHANHYTHERPRLEMYRQFRDALIRATALARAGAARRAYEDQPLQWLRYSPSARGNKDQPGWVSQERAGDVQVVVGVTVGEQVQRAKAVLDEAGRLPSVQEVVALAEAHDVPGLDDDLAEGDGDEPT